MDQKVIDLYDRYTHEPLDRRVFLARLAELTGGIASALALMPLLESNRAHAAMVAVDDPRLDTSHPRYPGATGDIKAYMARPKGASKLPAVIVVHENRGLNPHIEDVTRRVAVQGFLALAPDFLSPLGGTPADEDTARDMTGKLDAKRTTQNAVAAVAFLEKHPNSNGKVGVIGFCWGGTLVGEVAVNAPHLDAAVVYYGRPPKTEDVGNIKAPLLLHYAGLDKRVNEGVPAFEDALKKSKKKYVLYMYEGANHAFNNDTGAARYNKQAAELAWSRTIAFLKEHLNA